MSNPQLDSNTKELSAQSVIGACELVRGREQEFVAELRPLVHAQSLRVDLSSIERIDAAGLAALVSLYCEACRAGHAFAVVHPPERVARILALVGLDRILLSDDSRDALLKLSPVDLAAA